MPTRREILEQSIAAREEEITYYDINIANYQHSLEGVSSKKQAKIARRAAKKANALFEDDVDADDEADALIEYEPKLGELIKSEKRERAKAALFLEAAKKQLASLPADEA